MTRFVLSWLAVVAVVGCGNQATSDKQPESTRSQTAVAKTEEPVKDPMVKPAASNEVTLRTVSFDELQATIAKHKGKIVVCDFWSTSCEPCVREFPHLVALSQKYPAEKVVCISASLDFDGLGPLENYKGPVLEFLKEQQAKLDNVLFSEEDTAVYEKLKIASIPAVAVYGTDGERKKLFDESSGKPFTYEADINPLVAELVQAAE